MVYKSEPPPCSKHLNLKKSFKLGIRSLLTACSKEDVHKMFSTFSHAEKDGLHRMFIQVVKSLHEKIEEEFETICQETQVGTTLDKIEQIVEEQNLDILSADKTSIGDVKEKLTRAKKDEIQYLTSLLEKTEEQNNHMKSHIHSFKEKPENSATADALGKLKSWNTIYERFLSS